MDILKKDNALMVVEGWNVYRGEPGIMRSKLLCPGSTGRKKWGEGGSRRKREMRL